MKDVRRLVIIALLSGVAVVIYAVESFIPTPSPWLRLGFSHIITLFALLFFGAPTAFMVFCIRTFVGSLIIGKLFSPTFILGFVGGRAALAVMACDARAAQGEVVLGGRDLGRGCVGQQRRAGRARLTWSLSGTPTSS